MCRFFWPKIIVILYPSIAILTTDILNDINFWSNLTMFSQSVQALEFRIGQNVAKYYKLGWETVYITEKSRKKPDPPELPDCKGEKLSDLSEYQKLANIQYQKDVKGVWISGKDYFLEVLNYSFESETTKFTCPWILGIQLFSSF